MSYRISVISGINSDLHYVGEYCSQKGNYYLDRNESCELTGDLERIKEDVSRVAIEELGGYSSIDVTIIEHIIIVGRESGDVEVHRFDTCEQAASFWHGFTQEDHGTARSVVWYCYTDGYPEEIDSLHFTN